jgi:hypothetical protein
VTNSIRVSSVSLINGTIKKKSNSTDRRGKNADKIRTPPPKTVPLFTYLHIVYLCISTAWQFINIVCCSKVLFSEVGGMTQNKNSCILIKH